MAYRSSAQAIHRANADVLSMEGTVAQEILKK